MFAHRIVDFTGPDDVQWAEVDEPAADGGVLIDVAAAGVSFADLLQTRGAYQMKVPLPYTPGMDAAGVVRSAPPGTGPNWSSCGGQERCPTLPSSPIR